MTRRFDPACQAALLALLARPDERRLRGRGHRLTQAGAATRWDRVFVPAARTWIEHRRAAAVGTLEGWHSAVLASHRERLLRFRERAQ